MSRPDSIGIPARGSTFRCNQPPLRWVSSAGCRSHVNRARGRVGSPRVADSRFLLAAARVGPVALVALIPRPASMELRGSGARDWATNVPQVAKDGCRVSVPTRPAGGHRQGSQGREGGKKPR